jgi:hypothetical protein
VDIEGVKIDVACDDSLQALGVVDDPQAKNQSHGVGAAIRVCGTTALVTSQQAADAQRK